MQRILTLFFLSFSFLTSFTQNETYSIYNRTIIRENVSYTEAKRAWLAVDNARERFDPVCTLDLLSQSLEQGDTIFFKEELSFLIEARGFELNERYAFEDYYDDLTIGNLKQWYDSTFSEKNPIWERQFIEGYFDTSLLKTFDLTSEIFTGKQYFGTLVGVPCEDEEGLEARKVRFGLLN